MPGVRILDAESGKDIIRDVCGLLLRLIEGWECFDGIILRTVNGSLIYLFI
jgi:hypothetical protein